MAEAEAKLILIALLAMATLFQNLASDPSPLQDFCVADLKTPVSVNGYACKHPDLVTLEDFSFSGLAEAASTGNHLGSNITIVIVERIPGLNTLVNAMSRIDYASYYNRAISPSCCTYHKNFIP